MLQPTKVTALGRIPVFQEVSNTAQGGFVLSETVLPEGTELKSGTPIGYDESTRIAKVAKVAILQAAVTNTATSYPVLKGSNLAIGMSIKLSTGGTARAITGITTTDPDFDAVVVGTTIGAAANPGDAVFVDDEGYNKYRGLLFLPVKVYPGAEVAVVIEGIVYERRMGGLPATLKAINPNIQFSQSY